MNNQGDKLEKFKKAVFSEVDMKTSLIQQKAEMYKEHELEHCKDRELEKSYYMIQNQGQEIKNECKREVAKFSLEAKRSLLNKRNEIKQRVFDNVYHKLLTFSDSMEYKEYIKKAVASFSKKNPYEHLTFLVRNKDLVLADDIKSAYENPCQVKSTDSIILGGFIAINEQKGVYFDESFEQKLAGQHQYFIEHSQLAI